MLPLGVIMHSNRARDDKTIEIRMELDGVLLSLVLTSDESASITTYASAVSTSWSVKHFVFPKFKRTHLP